MAKSITFKCGHKEDRGLSRKKPFERAGFAAWLAKQPCGNCDPKQKARRAKWITQQRAAELADARAVEQRFQLEPLTGPAAILDWATRTRAVLVAAAFDDLDLDEDTFATRVAEPASQIDSAGWWLDHRETDLQQLPTELAAALTDTDLATAATGGTENLY